MKTLPLTFAVLAISAFPALSQDAPVVTSPVTGEEISITDIDMSALSDEQIQDIQDQVATIRDQTTSTMERTRERSRERANKRGSNAAVSAGMGAGVGGAGGGADGGHGAGGGGRP